MLTDIINFAHPLPRLALVLNVFLSITKNINNITCCMASIVFCRWSKLGVIIVVLPFVVLWSKTFPSQSSKKMVCLAYLSL